MLLLLRSLPFSHTDPDGVDKLNHSCPIKTTPSPYHLNQKTCEQWKNECYNFATMPTLPSKCLINFCQHMYETTDNKHLTRYSLVQDKDKVHYYECYNFATMPTLPSKCLINFCQHMYETTDNKHLTRYSLVQDKDKVHYYRNVNEKSTKSESMTFVHTKIFLGHQDITLKAEQTWKKWEEWPPYSCHVLLPSSCFPGTYYHCWPI